jgi:hypothetical protein
VEKLKQHLLNNFAIYMVILACIIVISVALFITSKPKVETVDTSMFKVVTLKETLDLFESDEAKLLVMSVPTCTATIGYTPHLQIVQAKQGYHTYYLDLTTIDTNSEDFKKLQEKLDFEYNFMGTIDKFSKFIENTPSTIIIKNKKQVFGHIGSISTNALETYVKLYGVGQ